MLPTQHVRTRAVTVLHLITVCYCISQLTALAQQLPPLTPERGTCHPPPPALPLLALENPLVCRLAGDLRRLLTLPPPPFRVAFPNARRSRGNDLVWFLPLAITTAPALFVSAPWVIIGSCGCISLIRFTDVFLLWRTVAVDVYRPFRRARTGTALSPLPSRHDKRVLAQTMLYWFLPFRVCAATSKSIWFCTQNVGSRLLRL